MSTPESDILDHGTMELRVRYNECDPMGVAHHSRFPVWFEMGRTELLRATGWTYRQFEEEGVFLAVIDLAIKYRKPARYDDLLMLHTSIEGGSRVKIKHSYQLKHGEDLLATGRSTLACLTRSGEVQPIPDLLMKLITATEAKSLSQ